MSRTPEETLADIERLGYSEAARKWQREANFKRDDKPQIVVNTKTPDGEHLAQIAALRGNEIIKQRLTEAANTVPAYDRQNGNVYRQMILENTHVALGGKNPLKVRAELARLEALAAVEDQRLAQRAEINRQAAAVQASAADVQQRAKAIYEYATTLDSYSKSLAEKAIDLAARGEVEKAEAAIVALTNHVTELETAQQQKLLVSSQPTLEAIEASRSRLAGLHKLTMPAPVESSPAATPNGEPSPVGSRVYGMVDGKLVLQSEPQIEGGSDATTV